MSRFDAVKCAAAHAVRQKEANRARLERDRRGELLALVEEADIMLDRRRRRSARQNPDPDQYVSASYAAGRIGTDHNHMLYICDAAIRKSSAFPDSWSNRLTVIQHDGVYWIEKESLWNALYGGDHASAHTE